MASLLEILASFPKSKPSLPILPPHPDSWSAPQIPVAGNPILANLVFLMQQREPKLGRLISRVQTAPTQGVISDWNQMKMPVEKFDKYDLMGAYDPKRKDIYIQPGSSTLNFSPTNPAVEERGQDVPSLQQILFHEIAHAKGANEVGARRIHKSMDSGLHEALYLQVMRRLHPELLSKAARNGR